MASTQDRSPEEWEAKDHIEALKRGLNQAETCEFHDDSTRADIWQIRQLNEHGKKLDTIIKSNGHDSRRWFLKALDGLIVRAPYAAAAIILFGMWMYCKAKGWL